MTVFGTPDTLYAFDTSPVTSIAMGNESPYSLANWLASDSVSSTAMAINSTLLLSSFRYAASSDGASALHGPHQDAQKFTTTALPRFDSRSQTVPSRVVRVIGAARSSYAARRSFAIAPLDAKSSAAETTSR